MGKVAVYPVVSEYQGTKEVLEVAEATPYRLVCMMYEGVTDRITSAKDAMEKQEVALTDELLSQAIAIVDALRVSLNLDEGGGLAENLWRLYEYVAERLIVASDKNSVMMLDECYNLLIQVQEAWDEMPVEIQNARPQELRGYAVAR
jgi:flagellar secretion chaperone FliS